MRGRKSGAVAAAFACGAIAVAIMVASSKVADRTHASASGWSVDVWSGQGLTNQERDEYQSAATAISAIGANPAPRLAYWAAVNNPPFVVVTSWGGSVHSLTPDGAGGFFAIVLVAPEIRLADGSTPFVTGCYSEKWHVAASGVATFVEAYDPEGWGGLIPPAFVES